MPESLLRSLEQVVHTFTGAFHSAGGASKVLYSDGSGVIQELAVTATQFVKSNGASAAPTAATEVEADSPGYTWQFPPWMTRKAVVGTWVRTQDSSEIGGGVFTNSSDAQNDSFSNDVYIDPGTVKFATIGRANTNKGILTLQFDGVSQGTADFYATPAASNTYLEITGITVSLPGIRTVTCIVATRNLLSTVFELYLNSIALIRTGA